ncbi:hypothetical protein [Leucothrix pacifica]|uniref:Lipoprotein n=1 Tax=Leucothrix pacifica TaxID=1247513 RepID=A0A317CJW6_9GAMM|nr:hypothetical protein [Leucothrix pacifica]PWQ96622.1 hypothetical protein DKW60_12625 [Leucothrix pacifica]
MKKFVLVLTLLTLSACNSSLTSTDEVPHDKPQLTLSQEEKWNKMVGKWYGKQTVKGGGKRQWIVERKKDGTYKIHFRIHKENGKISESSEVGQWAISGPVYLSMFRGYIRDNEIDPVDPSDPYNYDAYEILELNEEIFKYRHYELNATYTLKKVAEDFKFPE